MWYYWICENVVWEPRLNDYTRSIGNMANAYCMRNVNKFAQYTMED